MTVSLTTQQRIAELREKARAGTMTMEDQREAIAFLRAERTMMAPAKAATRTKTPKPTIDGNDLLSQLGISI